jgi:hypothetical protein
MDVLGCAVTEGGDKVITLPGCGHRFHKDCIRGWTLRGNFSCPLCRLPTKVESEVLQPIPMVLSQVLTHPADASAGDGIEEIAGIQWLAYQCNILALGMKERNLMHSALQIQLSSDRIFVKTGT